MTTSEAEQVVLNDPFDLDLQIHDDEERYIQLGTTDVGRILVVVLTVRDDLTRVVTAFPAKKVQQTLYYKARGLQ